MICEASDMAVSPLSSVLSPAQIAILQQARAALARPSVPSPAQPQGNAAPAGVPEPAAPLALRGRGQIINITV
jgi:hypothetical protein